MSAEEQIFNTAVEIDDPKMRAEFLDQACADDTALRASVEQLLAIHATDEDFLETPALHVPPLECDIEQKGRIGPYLIRERLGEGGFGIVYRAEQETPIHRDVAIKILKPGMDSHQVLRRFQFEKQTLATMNHANIAMIFDAGMTDSRPYFVMEYIPGIAMDRYCDVHRLSVRQRVKLMLDVCDAIEHAHQKGVVHRDLKPTNVLVAQQDSHPVIRVIDFGIAKALDSSNAQVTGQHQVVGTPEYMSPEQRDQKSDVDTRSDVYSLGALLCKLLIGTSPYSYQQQHNQTPSTLLSKCFMMLPAETKSRIAAAREFSEAKLLQMLRGELDWILKKATDESPCDRYSTVHEFSADLRAFLEHRPVQAGPPTFFYRARKIVQRNPVAAVGILAAGLFLVLGVTVSTIGFWQAQRAEKKATLEWKNAAEQRDIAEQQRLTSDSVSNLLEKLIGIGDPDQGHPYDYPVRELLNEFSDEHLSRIPSSPEVESRIRRVLGRSYWNFGDLARAGPHLERALSLRQEHFGSEHFLTLQSSVDHALYLFWTCRINEAHHAARFALDRLAKRPPSEELMWAQNVLCNVHYEFGEHDQAKQYIDQAVKTAQESLGSDHPVTLCMLARAARAHSLVNELKSADQLSETALARIRQVRPEQHCDVAFVKRIRARVLQRLGSIEEAKQMVREALETDRQLLGEQSNKVVLALLVQSQIMRRDGAFSDAIEIARQAVDLAEKVTVQRDTLRSRCFRQLAVLVEKQHPEQAAIAWSKAINAKQLVLGEHPEVARMMVRQAALFRRLNRWKDAETCYRNAIAIVTQSSRDEMFHTSNRATDDRVEAVVFVMTFNLFETLIASGQQDEARRVAAQFLENITTAESPVPKTISNLLRAHLSLADENLERAEAYLSEVDETTTGLPGMVNLRIRSGLIRSEIGIQRSQFDAAEKELMQLARLARNRRNALRHLRSSIQMQLARLYDHWGRPVKAQRRRIRATMFANGQTSAGPEASETQDEP